MIYIIYIVSVNVNRDKARLRAMNPRSTTRPSDESISSKFGRWIEAHRRARRVPPKSFVMIGKKTCARSWRVKANEDEGIFRRIALLPIRVLKCIPFSVRAETKTVIFTIRRLKLCKERPD